MRPADREAAVSMVVSGSGRMLCVWNKRYQGWSLPGGMVEAGETVEQAQARELMEETGLETVEATPLYNAPHFTRQLAERGSHVHVFLVKVSGRPKAMEEGCPIRWMTRQEYLTKTAFQGFYKKCFEAINWPLTPAAETRRVQSFEEFCRSLDETGLRDEVFRLALRSCATIFQVWERDRKPHIVDARNSVYELLAYDYGWSRGAIADLFGRDLNSVKLPRRAPVVIPGLQVEVVEKDQAHGLNGTHGPPLMLPEATQ